MINNITIALNTINDIPYDELYKIVLYFKNGYTIEFDSNGVPLLYNENNNFIGVYESYYYDLVHYGGLMLQKEEEENNFIISVNYIHDFMYMDD